MSSNKTQKRFRCSKGYKQVPPKSKNCVKNDTETYYTNSRGSPTNLDTLTSAVENVYSREAKHGDTKSDIKTEFIENDGDAYGYRKATASEITAYKKRNSKTSKLREFDRINTLFKGGAKTYYINSRGSSTNLDTLTSAVENVYSREAKHGDTKSDIKTEFIENDGDAYGYRKATASEITAYKKQNSKTSKLREFDRINTLFGSR